MSKIKNIFFAIGGGILAALFFIAGRGTKTSGSVKGRVNKNRDNLQQLSKSDRKRNDDSRRSIEEERSILESERTELESERNITRQSGESVGRVRSIIDNTRKSIVGIMGSSTGNDEGEV